ncbi:MAG: hypothetical protein ABI557_20540, partial [Aureliella sp.]
MPADPATEYSRLAKGVEEGRAEAQPSTESKGLSSSMGSYGGSGTMGGMVLSRGGQPVDSLA